MPPARLTTLGLDADLFKTVFNCRKTPVDNAKVARAFGFEAQSNRRGWDLLADKRRIHDKPKTSRTGCRRYSNSALQQSDATSTYFLLGIPTQVVVPSVSRAAEVQGLAVTIFVETPSSPGMDNPVCENTWEEIPCTAVGAIGTDCPIVGGGEVELRVAPGPLLVPAGALAFPPGAAPPAAGTRAAGTTPEILPAALLSPGRLWPTSPPLVPRLVGLYARGIVQC
jgi:hypothetical protein